MKIVFTIGKFDCLHVGHLHLIKEMRKLALPDGKIIVFLFDDYFSFLRDKKFPIQSRDHRKNNLEFLVEDIRICYGNEIKRDIFNLTQEAKRLNSRLIFIGANKEIPEKEHVKSLKIPFRIINKITL